MREIHLTLLHFNAVSLVIVRLLNECVLDSLRVAGQVVDINGVRCVWFVHIVCSLHHQPVAGPESGSVCCFSTRDESLWCLIAIDSPLIGPRRDLS